MKFQNPSFKFFWTDRRTNEQTDKRTDKPKAICSPLFQSWGHNDHKCKIPYVSNGCELQD